MHLSYTTKFAIMRAKAEARHAHRPDPGVEFLFLGLLKLSEMQARDLFRLSEADLALEEADIQAVRALFQQRGIDSSALRSRLRWALRETECSDQSSVEVCLGRALVRAAQRGQQWVWAQDAAAELLDHPTEVLRPFLPQPQPDGEDIPYTGRETPQREENQPEQPDKDQSKPETDQPDTDKPEQSASEQPEQSEPAQPEAGEDGSHHNRDYLSELTARVRKMRSVLLGTVQGQDHVVHAFTEGMFAAQVLAAADGKRQRPRAIFAFAGPPGVGKTFLAQTAAEALGMPFKRFDMSGYSDHQAHSGLIGFEKSYKDAREGTLTGWVKKHPDSVLLFDEIEKAHLNTVQLFLQILDAGRLYDRFLDEEIAFRDTVIIFTSNAAKALYEGEGRCSAAGVPRNVLLDALKTEQDPRTGQPFFPAAITSRLATGWPLLFNHLAPHDLEQIAARELNRCAGLFRQHYGMESVFDPRLAAALLYREGGQTDARTLRAQAERFFKAEVFRLCSLWGEDSFPKAARRLASLRFVLETEDLSEDVAPLFQPEARPEVLVYGEALLALRCREALPDIIFHHAETVEAALTIAGERDIRLALVDVTARSFAPADAMATVLEEAPVRSYGDFEFMPMAASALRDGTRLFRALRERLPEVPVYLLESAEAPLDEELTMAFVQSGARGKLTADEDVSVLADEVSTVCRQLWMQHTAARLARERKVLGFDIAPRLSPDGSEVTLRLRDFALRSAIAAEDAGSVLDEVEKPALRFTDVIGCADAKGELTFFIDYLKNPKKFSAQGLTPPKGVLLYGPPGTGKTLLAKALAGESGVAFLPAVGSGFVTRYQGSGPEAVRELFRRARRYAPAIVFIDELDAIGRKRGAGNSAHGEEMALNALLTEMDGFAVDPRRPVFVLAATNYDVEEGQGGMGVLDPALVRRFDRRVLVDLPNAQDREALLRLLLRKRPGHQVTDAMLRRTAQRSVGMSPAQLTAVVEQAARLAARSGQALEDGILDEAFELTRFGERKDWGYEYLERVARHESGHALLNWLGGNTPAYLTIVARGSHGGYMEHAARELAPLSTRDQLLWRIRTSLGGRAAELLYYGPEEGVSTGASGDLQQATRTAAAMLCAYGMDADFGLACWEPDKALSDPAFRGQVNLILRRELSATLALLEANRPRLDRLVKGLLERNKLNGAEIEGLLQG